MLLTLSVYKIYDDDINITPSLPVLDMIKLRRLHVGSYQSGLRHVIDHITFEFLQEP